MQTQTITRFVNRSEALSLVKPRNHAILAAGHKLSVSPGVLIQAIKRGAVTRYQITETK